MAEGRGVIRKVAAERIEILYEAAVRAFPKDQALSKGYIKLLLEIGRHYKVRIPKETAARICKKCSLPLMAGVNSQMRVIAKEKRIIYRCVACGATTSLLFEDIPSGIKENRISIDIDAPVKEVFKFTITPKNTPLWIKSIVKEEANHAKVAIGTRYRNLNRKDVWSEYVVSDFKQDKVFEMEQSGSPYSVRYTYEKLGANKTRLTYFEWVKSGFIDGPFELSVLQELKKVIEKK